MRYYCNCRQLKLKTKGKGSSYNNTLYVEIPNREDQCPFCSCYGKVAKSAKDAASLLSYKDTSESQIKEWEKLGISCLGHDTIYF
tara:strand:+ start:111 stop:365 length:255 start_codon:yes stop_codon:yes gene_type:complete